MVAEIKETAGQQAEIWKYKEKITEKKGDVGDAGITFKILHSFLVSLSLPYLPVHLSARQGARKDVVNSSATLDRQ